MIKILLISILLQLMLLGNAFANESIYKTNFYDVNIDENFIQEAKEKEISRIKKISFENITKRILNEEELKKLKKKNINLNLIVKNILIEDEFISENKYKAKIKINFDNTELVNLFRKYKINYTDYQSPAHLLIVAEKKLFSNEGLSLENSFYKKKKITKYGLINLKYPYLSPNDRFLIPFNKIINMDKVSLKNISNKYKTNFVFIVLIENKNNSVNLNINLFTSHNNQLINLNNFSLINELNYEIYLYNFLNNWWKAENIINNSIINNIKCFIKNSNIHELNFMNSKINLISQVKSNILNQIKLGLNINEIIFYGDIINLISKLSYEKITLQINSNNECLIYVSN